MKMDETSGTVNELGMQWNAVLQFKEGTVSTYDLESALKSVHSLCCQSGLPLVCIDSLIDVLFKLTEEYDDPDLMQDVIYNLIPNEPLSQDQTDRLFHWFKATYRFKTAASQKLTYWFVVALKVGLIDYDQVRRNCYYSLFAMFINNVQDDGLCFLLKDLTQAHHVTNASLIKLKKCYSQQKETFGRKLVAVLFKHYTNMSPNTSTDVSISKLVLPAKLKSKDKELEKTLDSLIAINATETTANISSSKIYEDLSLSENEANISVTSVGITPVYDGSSGQIKVTSLTRISDLLKHYDNLEAPANLLSILGGKCGASYVALSSPEWQMQLEEQIRAVLTSLLNNKPHPNINYSSLFKGLNEVQKTACQGIPSVTDFLKHYFVLWDGLKFRSEIFELITWTHFNTYNELKEFMFNLLEVFIVSDLKFRIELMDVFGSLYRNLVSLIAVRVAGDMHIPFITKPPTWMTVNTLNVLENLIQIFEKFVLIGLITQKSGSGFLLQTLSLYHQIFLVEQKFNVNMFTILPPSAFLMCQTSSSVAVFNSLSLLITRYWNNKDNMGENMNEITIMYKEKLGCIQRYALDTVRLLKQGLGGDTLSGTLLGELVGETECQQFKSTYGKTKDILSIMKNCSTSPVIYELVKKMKVNLNTITQEHYSALLEMFAPHCASLLQAAYDSEESELIDSVVSRRNYGMDLESMEV